MEVERIQDQLYRCMEGDAWHGLPVLELLQGITARQAASHPIESAHSIWELVLHMNCWQEAVLRRLQGDDFDYAPEADWPRPENTTEADWLAAKEHLLETYHQLKNFLATMPEEALERQTPGKNYSLYIMLHGLVQHTLYHAGQIALLKKLSHG
jgi:uncharacterized damage-inducible protein DinB